MDTIADGLDLNMGYWYKYNEMMKQVSTENCLEVLQQLALELEGKKFRCTDWNYEIIKKHFCNKEIALFFVFHFQSDKMNKTEIMRGFIDANAVEALAAAQRGEHRRQLIAGHVAVAHVHLNEVRDQ